MTIEGIKIDCDEDGFHLIVEGEIELRPGDFEDDDGVILATRPLNLRLSQQAAFALVRAVDETIRPWADEGEAIRREVERGGSICGHDGWVAGCLYCEREEAAASRYVHDPIEALASDPELARHRADIDRKRRREEGR